MNVFDEIAREYSAARPGYPKALWQVIYGLASERDVPKLAIDVGAGTGISTRQLAEILSSWSVVAVEPSEGMLAQAVRDNNNSQIEHRTGTAEDLPIADQEAGLVLAAQAVQWFNRPAFYSEARRVLTSHGFVAIIQNNRNFAASDFLDRYESLLEATSPGYSRWYRTFDIAQELHEAGFADIRVDRISWHREMSCDQFVTMARSSSKMDAAIRCRGEEATIGELLKVLERYSTGDLISIPYCAELYVGDN